jgi:GDP-mannose 6-dehydrogenase
VGPRRRCVESMYPHLVRSLTDGPKATIDGADVVIVALSSCEVAEALLKCPPPRIIDLDGRLGPEVEALPCYEGIAW